jgi:predicted nuclease with TOPRIM domain
LRNEEIAALQDRVQQLETENTSFREHVQQLETENSLPKVRFPALLLCLPAAVFTSPLFSFLFSLPP